jgi:hypothetical protein
MVLAIGQLMQFERQRQQRLIGTGLTALKLAIADWISKHFTAF